VPLYHTGIFAIDTPDEAASAACGAASFIIDAGLVTGSPEKMRRTIARLQKERLGTFGSTYESAGRIRIHNEIRISSEDLEHAYEASHTLVAAMAVSDGNSLFLPDDDLELQEPNNGPAPFLLGRQMQRPISLAARISNDNALLYAVHRLALSYRSASVHHIDLDPVQSPQRFTSSSDPYVHVHLANAISLAYAAIEQLDLGVKASRENPSKMPDGSWNVAVRKNLEQRLFDRKIEITEPQVWTLRGPPTPIELKKSPPAARSPSRWRNPDVRDRELDLLDCINLGGWFRNNLGFHGLSHEIAPHMTIYDAFNVQHVARRLIMASAGLW
jgi:hypothetical protein